DSRGSLAKKVPKGVDAIKAVKAKLPPHTVSKQANPLVRGLAVIISLVALISILVVILPQAQVTYYPATSIQDVEIRIKASEVFSGINPSGNIPEKPLFVEVNGERSIPSSGKVIIPTTKATGEVVFTNLTNTTVTLPAGTLLLAGDQTLSSFSLSEPVNVPAGLKGSAVGQVEALVAGVEGNLAPESTWTLSGGMDALVSVKNLDAFSGGGGVETPTPTKEDYATLERQLLADLMDQGLTSLMADQAEGVGLIEPSLVMDKILLSEQVNKIGEPADEAILRLNVRLKIFTYQLDDLNTIADLVLTSNQSAGFVPMDEKVTLTQVGDFRVDDFGQATWTINASRLLVPDWNMEQTAAALAGMKVIDAQSVFSSLFAQNSPAVIKVWFANWPWMPYLSTNIHFVDGASQ
ncbi:hypothetical protein EG832_11310, partial [bacterium]|nr:hypothetical protein [bacterium]